MLQEDEDYDDDSIEGDDTSEIDSQTNRIESKRPVKVHVLLILVSFRLSPFLHLLHRDLCLMFCVVSYLLLYIPLAQTLAARLNLLNTTPFVMLNGFHFMAEGLLRI